MDRLVTHNELPGFAVGLQQLWRHSPLVAGRGDHGDGLAIVSSDHAANHLATGTCETDGLTDAELYDPAVLTNLLHEAQPFDNHVIEVNQLLFGEKFEDGEHPREVVGVGCRHRIASNCNNAVGSSASRRWAFDQ